MALLSAAKRLFIPNKAMPDVKQPEYGVDMRAIENFNPINVLTAGSGVTLNPANGEGPTVEISASGGSGGNSYGICQMMGGPDENNDLGIQSIMFGSSPNFGTPVINGTIFTVLLSNSSGSTQLYTIGQGWATFTEPGDSVSYLPTATMAGYTGGTVQVSCEITALQASSSAANYAVWDSGLINLASGASRQFLDTDFTQVGGFGTDLSLVGGSGNSGTGLVTAAGLSLYFGSFQIIVEVPNGVTFT